MKYLTKYQRGAAGKRQQSFRALSICRYSYEYLIAVWVCVSCWMHFAVTSASLKLINLEFIY